MRHPPYGTRTAPSLVAVFLLSTAAELLADQKQVLVVYGTRRDAQVVLLGDRELPRQLEAGLGERVDYYGEYLDVSRTPDPDYQAALRDFLRRKYRDQQFDVIIAMHDVALQFLAANRAELFPGIPIVFSTTAPRERRLPNSTGLIAPNQFNATVSLAARLQPNLRNVFVITGADRRDAEFERHARSQFQPLEQKYTFTYLSGLPTGELQNRLGMLPPDSMVYYLLVSRDGSGEFYHPLEYLERVAAASRAPVYSWVDSAIDRGVLGGSMRSQAKQIEIVGGLTLRVLRGERADRIPVVTANLHVPHVDWRQLRRWGIAEGRVPPDTRMMFESPSVWRRYRQYVVLAVGLILMQTALIGALLIQRHRRRHAEQQVSDSQSELRDSYDQIRRLAGRLLTAHEEERASIARDLHDHIGQELALLSNDLELLSGLSDGQTEAAADAAILRLGSVARSVRELSHQLHPATLKLVGLVASLQALQRESTTSRLTVSFDHEHVPPVIPHEVGLCLYRIVQEALQNAVKHGGAHHVRVRLVGHPDEISLEVDDDGAGFDPAAAARGGLGLLSMRERLDAIGGRLEVTSRPGAGTHVSVRAPVGWAGAAAVRT